jgi:hypothetical protein
MTMGTTDLHVLKARLVVVTVSSCPSRPTRVYVPEPIAETRPAKLGSTMVTSAASTVPVPGCGGVEPLFVELPVEGGRLATCTTLPAFSALKVTDFISLLYVVDDDVSTVSAPFSVRSVKVVPAIEVIVPPPPGPPGPPRAPGPPLGAALNPELGAGAVGGELLVEELVAAAETPVTAPKPAPTAKPPPRIRRDPRERDRTSLVGPVRFAELFSMNDNLRGAGENNRAIR